MLVVNSKTQAEWKDPFEYTPQIDPKTLPLGTVLQGQDNRYFVVKRLKRRSRFTYPKPGGGGNRHYWSVLTPSPVPKNSLSRMPYWSRQIGFEDFLCQTIPAADGDCLFACLAHCFNFIQQTSLEEKFAQLNISSSPKHPSVNTQTLRNWLANTITIRNVVQVLKSECRIQDRLVQRAQEWPAEWWSPNDVKQQGFTKPKLVSTLQSCFKSSHYLGNVETLRRLKLCPEWMEQRIGVIVFTSWGTIYPEVFGASWRDPETHLVCLLHTMHKARKGAKVQFHWQIMDWKNQGGTNFVRPHDIPICLERLLTQVLS